MFSSPREIGDGGTNKLTGKKKGMGMRISRDMPRHRFTPLFLTSNMLRTKCAELAFLFWV